MIFYCRLDFVIKKTDGAQFFPPLSWFTGGYKLGVGRGGVGSCDQVV